jgi:hypothetical protein
MVLLTKKEFINCLNFIYEQEEKQEQFVKALENLCPGNYCDCWLFNDYAEKYTELLKKLMDDKNDDIRYFLYDMERGKARDYAHTAYHNEEELYDYLIEQDLERSRNPIHTCCGTGPKDKDEEEYVKYLIKRNIKPMFEEKGE